jgi:two-component system phosphate regulon sensor histidine kinase PhoR
LLSGEPLSFWAPLGCGTLAAIGAAWMVFRPARRTTEALNATLRTLAPFGTVPVSPAPLLGAAAAIDEGVRELQARITALEQRETALAQNTALLETVLGTMVEGVIVVDGQERVLYLNGAARSLLDVPTRDVTGRPLLEIVRSPGIEEGARAALTSRTTHRAEFEIPRKEKAVDLTASPLAGDPERGAVLVLHDVTELRRLERMRREFVSNVSHELKTPLTAIQAYADTLSEGALDDPEHNRVFLDRIVEQSQRLEGLIVDLLRLGRIESQQAVELSPVSLSEVAVTCARDHEAVAAGKGLQLEVNCHESCVILAEAGNLRQVIDNLLDNAIKYTSPGGRITVSVWQETDSGVLEVADTGIGIPREEQGRIFERFYRVDRARARAIGGTGLGLSIVKHIVQQFQGLISVSSELGKGSRFTVRIPLAGS